MRVTAAAVLSACFAFQAHAQTESVAIPAIAFHGERVMYNETGTAAFIRQRAYAPVHLPDGARATSFTCGAKVERLPKGMKITLRRNHPQQANVDMGVVELPRGGDTAFKFLTADPLVETAIDNRRFNYYLVAEVLPKSDTVADLCNPLPGPTGVATSTECLVAACSVDYFPPSPNG